MRIISVDNFDREEPGCGDTHVCWVNSEKIANEIVRLLNEDKLDLTDEFFKVVPDDYELYEFEP